MLKRHEDYLNDNPDVFYGIQGRLLKAIDYGAQEDLEKADKPKVSRSGYRDWQPKEDNDYSPEQQTEIKRHMEQGYSHREAERFANAHDSPKDFQAALNHKVNPSQPSDKHLETLRDLALDYKKRSAKLEGEQASAGTNPQKYASHRNLQSHDEAYADYDKEYGSFLKELDDQDLHPNEYDEAVSKWQGDWHEKNPDAQEK